MILRNSTTNAIVATRIKRLTGLVERAVGLLGRARIGRDEGVWLSASRAIHTVGMRQAIDVMFVDGAGVVLRICRDVQPNCLMLVCRRARAVVELGGGALDAGDVTLGDRLELIAEGSAQQLRVDGFEQVGARDNVRC